MTRCPLPPAAIALALIAGSCSEPQPLPDAVVVVLDTLRTDRLPVYGFAAESTPTLSGLAARSHVFDNAWSTSSWTAPSTASIFTGLYPNQHGLEMGFLALKTVGRRAKSTELTLNHIPESIETIPVFFRGLGYRTFGIADNLNICEEEGFARGFDEFLNTDRAGGEANQVEYAGAEEVNRVVSVWADDIADAERSFVYLHYMDPHFPYHMRDPWFEVPAGNDRISRSLAQYDSEIAFLDHHIGQAFETLEVGPDTLVVVASDHGEEFGDHGSMAHGYKLYSELTRTCLLVHPPGGVEGGARHERLASLVDILPTLRGLLGAPPSEQDEGLDLLAEDEERSPRAVFSRRRRAMDDEERILRSVVSEGFHYILQMPQNEEQLYDLAADPEERNNLVEEQPERAAQLRERLESFEREARVWEQGRVTLALTEGELAGLQALGYTEEAEQR